jgi:hypothetical protein
MIHEHFYYNCRYAAVTSLAVSFARPVGRLALRDLNILFQVCLGLSGLRVPVSLGVSSVSLRTVMNNVGSFALTFITVGLYSTLFSGWMGIG